ncbi:unnamed protein product [Pleuronectes platessa]|uniref:Uncharacterized protein n=1 Tax=Pleuronectes platessa TaxID=8262 RepID=A0A9N7Y9D5_PLEPL|nr:unnamed protein product [Pleuronectes platessa]
MCVCVYRCVYLCVLARHQPSITSAPSLQRRCASFSHKSSHTPAPPLVGYNRSYRQTAAEQEHYRPGYFTRLTRFLSLQRGDTDHLESNTSTRRSTQRGHARTLHRISRRITPPASFVTTAHT